MTINVALVNTVYSCFLIMYCIVSYCVFCMYLICYLYTNVSTKVTRNKDIYSVTYDNPGNVSFNDKQGKFSLYNKVGNN